MPPVEAGGGRISQIDPAVRAAGAIGVAVGLLLLLAASSRGLGIAPDSVSYLRAAEDLAHLDAPTRGDGQPLDLWPPGYPAAVAAVMAVSPLGPEPAARVLAGALLALLVVVCAWASRRAGASPFVALGVAVLAVLGPTTTVAVDALSELLFTVLVLVGLTWAGEVAAAGPAAPVVPRRIWSAAVLLGLSGVVRSVGVVAVGAAAAVLLAAGDAPWGRRWRRAAALTAVSLAPAALWAARNVAVVGTGSPGVGAPDRGLLDNLHGMLTGLGRWVVPVQLPGAAAVAPGAVVAAGLGALVVLLWRRGDADARWCWRALPAALFALLFPLALAVAASATRVDPLGPRLLAPAWPAALVASSGLVTRWLQQARSQAPVRVLAGLVAAGALLSAVAAPAALVGAGRGVARAEWDGSALVAEVADLPEGAAVVSNAYIALGYRADRPVGRASRGAVRQDPAAGPVYVAWFSDPDRSGATVASDAARVRAETGYVLGDPVVVEDGVLYRAIALDPGAPG